MEHLVNEDVYKLSACFFLTGSTNAITSGNDGEHSRKQVHPTESQMRTLHGESEVNHIILSFFYKGLLYKGQC